MNKLKEKYHTQHTGARNRGIDWQFTYESWLAWWGDDIVNRGNKSGQLVMARIGDTGPYHPDNVRKVTCNENHSEAHKNGLGWTTGRKHSDETRAKISASSKGRTYTGVTRQPWTEERKATVRDTWANKAQDLAYNK